MKSKRRVYNHKGFTLIEIAIILVILGLLIGVGAALLGPLTKRIKINETRESIDAAVEAVISYASGNKCLPGNLTTANVRKLIDAWNKPLLYIYSSELGAGSCVPYDKDICGRKSTLLKVRVCDNQACSSYREYSNIAFLILSGGPNYNIQFDNQTLASNVIRIYNYGIPNVDHYTVDVNRPEEFDDLIKWVTLDELRVKMGCPGAQLRIITTELPIAYQGQGYNGTILVEGGVPPYTFTYPSPFNGLNFNVSNNTLFISGTPKCAGTYSLNISVKDSDNNNASKAFALIVQSNPLRLNPPQGFYFTATNGTPFSAVISPSGGSGVYTPGSTTCGSCAGLSCTASPTQATISGTPTSTSTCSFNISYRDECNTIVSGTYHVQIVGGGSSGPTNCPTMSLNPSSGYSWSATVGSYFSATINVSGGYSPITNTACTLSGTCSGLTINCSGTTAQISGTPTSAGTCSVSVAWRDSCPSGAQTISGSYTINIQPPSPSPQPLTIINRSGGTRYYRLNNGPCTLLNNNNNVTIGTTDTIRFYTTLVRCNNNLFSCSHTFTSLKNYDLDNDNQIRLTGITGNSCNFADE